MPLTALAGIVLGGALLLSPAQADPRRLSLMPDPRGEFIRLCAPFMMSRYLHPEAVCDCLRNALTNEVADRDLLDAILYGVTERGVPTLNEDWLPPEQRALIGPTMTAIAEPTLACMFGDRPAIRKVEPVPIDGQPAMPPVQDLTP